MPAKSLSILLADDDQEDIELLEEIILDIQPGTQVTYVSNGKEIIDFLTNCKDTTLPDLIILDYNMPRMTAAEVLAKLKNESRYKVITKVVLSTSGSKEHVKQCMSNGARDYFVKPGNIRELKTITKKMISMCTMA